MMLAHMVVLLSGLIKLHFHRIIVMTIFRNQVDILVFIMNGSLSDLTFLCLRRPSRLRCRLCFTTRCSGIAVALSFWLGWHCLLILAFHVFHFAGRIVFIFALLHHLGRSFLYHLRRFQGQHLQLKNLHCETGLENERSFRLYEP